MQHGPREHHGFRLTGFGQARHCGPPGIVEPEQLGGLVEGFAGGVVQGFAQNFVDADLGHPHQLRMAARYQQCDEGEGRRLGRQQGRQQVTLKVMDADDRLVPCQRQRVGDPGADQQRAGQARSLGVGDRIDRGGRDAGALQHLAEQGQHTPDMVARRQFRHHAAVCAVHLDLRVQGVGEQPLRRVVQRQAGFVAGTFDTENEHGEGWGRRQSGAAQDR